MSTIYPFVVLRCLLSVERRWRGRKSRSSEEAIVVVGVGLILVLATEYLLNRPFLRIDQKRENIDERMNGYEVSQEKKGIECQ